MPEFGSRPGKDFNDAASEKASDERKSLEEMEWKGYFELF